MSRSSSYRSVVLTHCSAMPDQIFYVLLMKSVRLNVRLPGVSLRTQITSPRPAFYAYHGVTGDEHKAHFDEWSVQGYRMICLSVYADPDSPLYAAVWVQRLGPAWEAVHGVDGSGYEACLDLLIGKGYVPILISATGSFSHTIFAAVLERGITDPWLARYGMPSGPVESARTFENENANALAHKMTLRSVASYSTAADRSYAAVWHSNPDYVKSHVQSSDS